MKPLHALLLLFVVAVWGINFVFIKMGLDELPPLFLCFIRFFFLSVPAVLFFKKPPAFKMVVLYALVMFVLQFALMFSGMALGISAGLASILLQTQVFFSIFLAALLLKEKLNRWQVLGALISFSGICLIALKLGDEVVLPGFLAILAAAATWGSGSVIVKKMGKVSPASLITWSSTIAWPPLLCLSLVFEKSHSILLDFHHLAPQSYGALAFIILASTVFAFGVWNWLLQSYPVVTIAPFTLLVPIFGLLASSIFLNEPLESWKLLAACLVLSGLCLNWLGPRLFTKKATNL